MALGVGRGAGESPATFFSPPPLMIVASTYVSFPVEIAGPCNGSSFGSVWADSHSGGCKFSPLRVPVAAEFFCRVMKYLCVGLRALTREGASK